MTKNTFLFIGLALLVWSCGPPPHEFIQGTWQAQMVLEAGDTLPLDLSTTRLVFKPGRRYSFTNNLNYREEGEFRIQEPYLFTTNQLDSQKTEKAVEILLLEADTLLLKMREAGQERHMRLHRQH